MLCALLRNRVSISGIADGQEFQKMCIERKGIYRTIIVLKGFPLRICSVLYSHTLL